jgi:hypothetical protein
LAIVFVVATRAVFYTVTFFVAHDTKTGGTRKLIFGARTARQTGAVVFVLAVSAVRSTIAALLDLDALAIVTRELVASALGLCSFS